MVAVMCLLASAASDKSPVPTTRPPTAFAMSIVLLSSFPCLCVLESNVLIALLPNIRKCLCNCVTDWNFLRCRANCFDECFSIPLGTFACAKPRHRNPNYIASRQPDFVKAFAVTSKANVESSPPEIPITAFCKPVCFILLASPVAWMEKVLHNAVRVVTRHRAQMAGATLLSTEGRRWCRLQVTSPRPRERL